MRDIEESRKGWKTQMRRRRMAKIERSKGRNEIEIISRKLRNLQSEKVYSLYSLRCCYRYNYCPLLFSVFVYMIVRFLLCSWLLCNWL